MFKTALIALALVATVQSAFYIQYFYISKDCTGAPFNGIAVTLGQCQNYGIGSGIYARNGNNIEVISFVGPSCTGANFTVPVGVINSCNDHGAAVVADAFSPVPAPTDLTILTYTNAACGGSPAVTAVTYGVPFTGKTTCAPSDDGLSDSSSQSVAFKNVPAALPTLKPKPTKGRF